jgi:hypothetical protein
MKKQFYCISNIKKNIYYDLALGDQTLERALTLGARFCHRTPNARALSITAYMYIEQNTFHFNG